MPVDRQDRREGGLTISTITIDRPPLNILDFAQCQELASVLDEVHADDRTRVLVLRGAGNDFSAGVDIKQHDPERMPALLPAFHRIFRSLLQLPCINIAAVRGVCMGGAAELALACDRVLVEEGVRFGFPEISIGCYPPVAIPMLTHRAGHGRAVGAILGGEDIALEDLRAWGLVDGVAAKGGLDALLAREIERYHGKSPGVLGIAARLLHDEAERAWGARIPWVEREYLEKLLPHPDAAEGVAAFQAKRSPRWKGLDEPLDIDHVEGMAQ